MFNVKKLALSLAIAGIASVALSSNAVAGDEEGGYVGSYYQGHSTAVYNFLRRFNWEQYRWSARYAWENSNDYYVDAMDIAIYAGNGAPLYITHPGGDFTYLSNVGHGPDNGYGDRDLEFVAFEAPKVIPSPIEVSNNWSELWTWAGGVFDGLHQAMGFRTNSYTTTDQDVTSRFGLYVRYNYAVWQSWFTSINLEAYSFEKGCAVMYPTTQNDTYYNFAADPPANSTWQTCWWQN